MLGCTFRNVTDTHGCAELGKTVCMADSLFFNLHFVVNKVTETGPEDVAAWDDKMTALHGNLEKFNTFMNYRLVFYEKSLQKVVTRLVEDGTHFMLRKSEAKSDGVEW
jgi:hypothetical protein